MFKKYILALVASLAFVGLVPTSAQAAESLDLPSHPDVLIMGDSYTQGVGAIPETEGWAYNIGALGWNITRDGKGGSGYCNPTTYGAGEFSDTNRLWSHPANAYDLVVLQGSSNDAKYNDADLAGCINRTIRSVKVRYPDAKILMVGLTNPYGNFPADSPYWRVNNKLKSYADIYDINYISPMSEKWYVPGDGARYAQTEGTGKGHPNNAGYQVYANRFMKDVQNLD